MGFKPLIISWFKLILTINVNLLNFFIIFLTFFNINLSTPIKSGNQEFFNKKLTNI